MVFSTTQMSSKGQVVIPKDIRELTHSETGTTFAVTAHKDIIILKKMTAPSKRRILEEINKIARKSQEELEKQGITEEDVIKIALRARKNRS